MTPSCLAESVTEASASAAIPVGDESSALVTDFSVTGKSSRKQDASLVRDTMEILSCL